MLILIWCIVVQSLAFQSNAGQLQRTRPFSAQWSNPHVVPISESLSTLISRRQALLATSAASLALLSISFPAKASGSCGLDDITLGQGRWTPQNEALPIVNVKSGIPATFCTYASRFLIRYDEGFRNWWNNIQQSYSLLPDDRKQAKSFNTFGCLARSIQLALDRYLLHDGSTTLNKRYEDLASVFLHNYGDEDREARRHIALLFAMLPVVNQPVMILQQLVADMPSRGHLTDGFSKFIPNTPPPSFMKDLTVLLPNDFRVIRVKRRGAYTIFPPLSMHEAGADGEFAFSTIAGPLAVNPLKREQPEFTTVMYGLFGISGATSCALTHMSVIPLDVVKTRMQTDPEDSKNILDRAAKIFEKEGLQGLFLGSQATLAAYLWYGMSVYPSYTFFKRLLAHSLSPDIVTIHTNDIALIAGAMASAIASIGVTPMEACRIRTVAEPFVYKSKGLVGTIKAISTEDANRGWTKLYAGLPSLLTRQVIFGSIKFVAFERTCEVIYHSWPVLHDAAWTSLGVSLVAGGIAGVLSSIVSQPADSVLTYVSQNNGSGKSSLGVLEGSRLMIEQRGFGSLFRGLGSRCVWAGSIIGGQFLLYDVFRTYFGVNGDDLEQIYEVVVKTVVEQ